MKAKYILTAAVVLLLAIIYFMFQDFFYTETANPKNPYEYDLTKFKSVDSNLICYKEALQIDINSDILYGLSIDSQDRLYVSGKQTLFIYDESGKFDKKFALSEDAYCLSIAANGKIYLGMTDHVEVWNLEGEKLQSWESMGAKAIFTSIAVNENSVFVADAGNKIVYHYNHEGELQNTIGAKDKENGKLGFIVPSPYLDLLIGRDDELWVSNPGIHQLESYRANGEFISSWKRTSMLLDGFSGCCNPSHIAMISNGSFVTSEKGIERIKIHFPNGDFDCVVASPDLFIEGTEDLDLAVDSRDRIYVSDPKKGIIRRFDKLAK